MYGQIPNFLLQQSYGYHRKAEKVYNYNLLTFLGFNVMETTLLLTGSMTSDQNNFDKYCFCSILGFQKHIICKNLKKIVIIF